MRLIDADALYLELSRTGSHCLQLGTKTGISWGTAYADAELHVQNAPTIDAVEVVRCKDCKHFTPCEEVDGVSWTGYCNYGEFYTDEDDYCSRGERRADNATD